MKRNLQRIFRILQSISLPIDQQKRFLGFLAFTNNERLESIASQCERTPEWIPEFLELLEKKFAALCRRDQEAFQHIVEEEISVLTGLGNGVHFVGRILPNNPMPRKDEDRRP